MIQQQFQNRDRSVFLIILTLFVQLAFFASPALSRVEFYDVYIGDEKIFSVANTPLYPAAERGAQITARLNAIARDDSIDPSALEIRTGVDRVPVICIKDRVICGVTAIDAAQASKSQQLLAQDWLHRIRARIQEWRNERPQENKGTAKTGQAGGSERSSGLSEHAVLLLFIEISLLLLTALVCGELMVRLGQPAITGQILAGLLLGPTFFGLFFPDLSAQIFPRDGSQSRLIEVISWIGVSLLLMLTGMETDTAMLKRMGKPLLSFGLIGLFGPLIAGGIISLLLPDSLLGGSPNKLAFGVFIGTVFAASSVPVVAKILMDMNMLKLHVGQLIIATSLAHDLLCCLLLALIVVLAGTGNSGGNPILTAILGTICFLAVVFFGKPVFFAGLRWVNDQVSSKDGLITAMVVLLLASAATTQALGVHIVLGAFAAGVILSQAPVINHKVVRPLEIVTMAFFAPVFFAASGLSVDLSTLLQPDLGTVAALLTLASLGTKLLSCLAAGKLAGLGPWQSLSVGVGANAKGSLGLILAMLGYSLDIISKDMFALVIFISLFSTGIAAPLMKLTMSKLTVSDEERIRIKREERRARTILSGIRRVLCPTTGKGRNPFLIKFLNSIGQYQTIETTLFWARKSNTPLSEKPFKSLTERINRRYVGVIEKTIASDDPIEAIAEEANLGYDLVVMDADEPPGDANYVFSPLVDGVILSSSTRVLTVYDPAPDGSRQIRHVLVPVSGSELSIAAAEFGISVAESLGARVTCLSISQSEASDLYGETTQSGKKIEQNVSAEIDATLKELSSALNVEFNSMLVQTASHPAQAAILMAQQNDVDLIVLGAEPKLGKGLFFGHTINYMLRHAPCAIAVLKMRG